MGLIPAILWVSGLGILLATLGYALYLQAETRRSLRFWLGRPAFTLAHSLGFALFCLGLALSSLDVWWQALLWLLLALAFAAQVWAAQSQRRGVEVDLPAALLRLLKSDAPVVAGIIALALVLSALYAVTIRPWMQPDEPRHFEVALHVDRLNQPIVGYGDRRADWEQEIIADMDAESFWWYGYTLVGWDPANLPASFDEIFSPQYGLAFFQAPLYYAIAGNLIDTSGAAVDLSAIVTRLRFLGILFLAFSLLGIYALFRELFPQQHDLALMALIFAALWPSHLAANATVNNDPLVEMFVVWALYVAVRIIRRGPTLVSASALLVLGLLAVASKRSGFTALLLLPLALALWSLGRFAERWTWKRILAAGFVLLVGISALAGIAVAAVRSGRFFLPRDFIAGLTTGTYLTELAAAPIGVFLQSFWRTFIGWFGWMRVPLPEPFYWLGLVLLSLAGLGLIVAWRKRGLENLAGWQKRALSLMILALVCQTVLVFGKEVVFGTWRAGSLPQARYWYPVFPAIIAILTLGAFAWVRADHRKYLLISLLITMLLFNFYVIGIILYPFFWL